jgi:hypothetical protein
VTEDKCGCEASDRLRAQVEDLKGELDGHQEAIQLARGLLTGYQSQAAKLERVRAFALKVGAMGGKLELLEILSPAPAQRRCGCVNDDWCHGCSPNGPVPAQADMTEDEYHSYQAPSSVPKMWGNAELPGAVWVGDSPPTKEQVAQSLTQTTDELEAIQFAREIVQTHNARLEEMDKLRALNVELEDKLRRVAVISLNDEHRIVSLQARVAELEDACTETQACLKKEMARADEQATGIEQQARQITRLEQKIERLKAVRDSTAERTNGEIEQLKRECARNRCMFELMSVAKRYGEGDCTREEMRSEVILVLGRASAQGSDSEAPPAQPTFPRALLTADEAALAASVASSHGDTARVVAKIMRINDDLSSTLGRVSAAFKALPAICHDEDAHGFIVAVDKAIGPSRESDACPPGCQCLIVSNLKQRIGVLEAHINELVGKLRTSEFNESEVRKAADARCAELEAQLTRWSP